MFAVTPRTTLASDETVLTDSQRQYLGDNLFSCLSGDVPGLYYNDHYRLFFEKFNPFDLVTKEGKLTKRISKWVKKEFDHNLPSYMLEHLGSIVAHYHTTGCTYDITDTFDWHKGDFGDHGSCFWGDRSGARELIKDAKGLAIRFYQELGDDSFKGCGRAWILPYEGDWLVFNAYGPELKVIGERIKHIFPNAKVKKIELENMGDNTGLLYINSGVALYVSERAQPDLCHINLQLDEEGYGETCPCCDEAMNRDRSRWIESEDRYVCYHCYENAYSWCAGCDELFHEDSVSWVEYRTKGWRGGYIWTSGCLCSDCEGDKLTECERCFHLFNHDEISSEEVDGRTTCGECLEDHYTYCDTCYTYIENGDQCECQEQEDEEEQEPQPTMVQALQMNEMRVENQHDANSMENGMPYVPMMTTRGTIFYSHPDNVTWFLEDGWEVLAQAGLQVAA